MSLLQCCKSRVQIPTMTKILLRRYMKVSEQMELLLKKTDQVPRDYQLVYREVQQRVPSFMYHSFNFLTCLTLSTAVTMYYKGQSFFVDPDEVNEKLPIIVTNPTQGAVVLAFCGSVFFFMQIMRKRYPMRIYYSDKRKSYRAIFIGRLPFAQEFYDFPRESLTYVKRDTLFPWFKVLFNANGRKLYLFEEKFRKTSDFHQMFMPGEFIE